MTGLLRSRWGQFVHHYLSYSLCEVVAFVGLLDNDGFSLADCLWKIAAIAGREEERDRGARQFLGQFEAGSAPDTHVEHGEIASVSRQRGSCLGNRRNGFDVRGAELAQYFLGFHRDQQIVFEEEDERAVEGPAGCILRLIRRCRLGFDGLCRRAIRRMQMLFGNEELRFEPGNQIV